MATAPSIFSVDFSLSGLMFPAGSGADIDVVHHPAQDRVTAVGNPLLQHQLHQLLGGRGHILKALPERNNCEAEAAFPIAWILARNRHNQ